MLEEVLKPEQIMERALPGLGALTHCYGGIVILGAGGAIERKGSMVLVNAARGHFVFTARHVAEAVLARPGYMIVRPPEVTPENALKGVFHTPAMFPVSAHDLAWKACDMDIAAFRAPRALVELAYLRWFDAAVCVEATRNVRRLQQSREHSLLTAIMGCPNYGHFRDATEETVSLLPMLTYISALPAESWDGLSSVVPQVHLEIDDGSKREQPVQQGFRGQLQAALHNPSSGKDRLGGYSGGPIVVLGSDGEFLIGVVTEGGHLYDVEARAAGVAWDDIMTGFMRDDPVSCPSPSQQGATSPP